MKEFRTVSGLLAGQIGHADDPPMSDAIQSEIKRRWGRCAGAAADFSFPLLFHSGRLVVFTESAIWATELRHQQQAIADELAEFGIRRIEVKARPGILPRAKKKRRQVQLSTTNSQRLKSTADRIGHQGLRRSMARLAARGKLSKTESG